MALSTLARPADPTAAGMWSRSPPQPRAPSAKCSLLWICRNPAPITFQRSSLCTTTPFSIQSKTPLVPHPRCTRASMTAGAARGRIPSCPGQTVKTLLFRQWAGAQHKVGPSARKSRGLRVAAEGVVLLRVRTVVGRWGPALYHPLACP